jgi:hypothetical protein
MKRGERAIAGIAPAGIFAALHVSAEKNALHSKLSEMLSHSFNSNIC